MRQVRELTATTLTILLSTQTSSVYGASFFTSVTGEAAVTGEAGETAASLGGDPEIFAATTMPPLHSSGQLPGQSTDIPNVPAFTDDVITPSAHARPMGTDTPGEHSGADDCDTFRAAGLRIICASEPIKPAMTSSSAALGTNSPLRPALPNPNGPPVARRGKHHKGHHREGYGDGPSQHFGFPLPSGGGKGWHICNKIVPAYTDETGQAVDNKVYPCYGSFMLPTQPWHHSGGGHWRRPTATEYAGPEATGEESGAAGAEMTAEATGGPNAHEFAEATATGGVEEAIPTGGSEGMATGGSDAPAIPTAEPSGALTGVPNVEQFAASTGVAPEGSAMGSEALAEPTGEPAGEPSAAETAASAEGTALMEE